MSPMPHNPLITAIVPVHNGGRYLAEALESILGQGRDDCEIVVVDDGSTDDSAAVAARYGSAVRYLYQAQAGPGAARNSGIAAARGQYLSFLDADDLWMKDKLEMQLAAFERDPALDIVFGHVQQGYSPEMMGEGRAAPRNFAEVVPGHLPGTMLARREACSRVGSFTTRWMVGDGVDWYLRAVELQLHTLMLPDVLLWRRIHDTNMGIQERNSRQDYLQIVKAALDRRRAVPQIDGDVPAGSGQE
jgi:glycosyltransferase involved in cell wall biosynthesis